MKSPITAAAASPALLAISPLAAQAATCARVDQQPPELQGKHVAVRIEPSAQGPRSLAPGAAQLRLDDGCVED